MSVPHGRDAADTQPLPQPDCDSADPHAIGDLLSTWLGLKLDEVDALVDEARSKVDGIPDQRALWSLVGEVVVLLRALELEVADLRKEAGR